MKNPSFPVRFPVPTKKQGAVKKSAPHYRLSRQIDDAIDFDKLYEIAAELYCEDNGPFPYYKILFLNKKGLKTFLSPKKNNQLHQKTKNRANLSFSCFF